MDDKLCQILTLHSDRKKYLETGDESGLVEKYTSETNLWQYSEENTSYF